MAALWSRCTGCGTCEWNKVLASRNLKCSGCGAKVSLFRPKPKVRFGGQEEAEFDDGYDGNSPLPAGPLRQPRGGRSPSPGGKRNGGKGKGSSVQELLQQAVAATQEPQQA